MRVPAGIFLACLCAFAQQPDRAFRVGNGVSAPIVIRKTDPPYSEEARRAKLNGAVILSVVVGDDGKPRDLRVVRTLGMGLDAEAVAAVNTWQFKPGMKDGMPVPVRATIEVNFRLLPGPGSPWMLARAVFNTPEGVPNPVLTKAPYPPADRATSASATATISFEVDKDGIPANLHIVKSSDPAIESEVIGILRGWQFQPSTVPVQGTFDFAKGRLSDDQ